MEYYSSRKVDVPINILDISKAKKALKWKPCVPLKVDIQKMFKFWNGLIVK